MKQDLATISLSFAAAMVFVYLFKRDLPEPSAGSRLRSVSMGVRG